MRDAIARHVADTTKTVSPAAVAPLFSTRVLVLLALAWTAGTFALYVVFP